MQRALVIGDSGGIGGALRRALNARLGEAHVDGLSRTRDGLDIRDEARVEPLMAALEPPYDVIVIATGALGAGPGTPEKSLRTVTAEGLLKQFEINALGPALVIKHAVRLLPRSGRSVLAVLSARVGSIGDNRLGGWYGYRASKAALNQITRCAAVELRRSHRDAIVLAIHPGTVATGFTQAYQARHQTVPPEQAAANILDVVAAATTADSGQFLDWAGDVVSW